jgi:alpha-tubulin suppressor-like RCC1 family protein
VRSIVPRVLTAAVLAFLLPACGIGGGGTLTPTVAPGIPEGLTASSGNGRVMLTWTSTAAATSFTVSRSQSSGGPYLPVSKPSQFPSPTSYVDLGLLNGQNYYYIVTASNTFGTSPASAEAKGTPRFAARSISPGNSSHTLALLEDGTVWGWGTNTSGETGNGLLGYQDTPALALGLPRVSTLARGIGYSMALATDGTVWTWGDNTYNQLGRTPGPGLTGITPGPVPGLPEIAAIAAGGRHGLALDHDGGVWAWGRNDYGQVGTDSAGAPVPTPTKVAGLPVITAIGGGSVHSLALAADGTVWGWGINLFGELGLGFTSTQSIIPLQGKNLDQIIGIATGSDCNLALRSDRTVWSWGWGPLGQGAAYATATTPAQVLNLTNVVSISIGSIGMAARLDGTVWTWGDNLGEGELGTGSQNGTAPAPAQIPNLTGITEVYAGSDTGIALQEDGTVWTWGANTIGELGIGQTEVGPVPGQVLSLNQVTAIAAGGYHSQAIRADGTVWVWGSVIPNFLVTTAPLPPQPGVPGQASTLSGITAISGGLSHGLALKNDGTVWVWGSNASGQLANGISGGSAATTPIQVTPSGTVYTTISAGRNSCFAIRNDGTVWGWGGNDTGQIGNGDSSGLPVKSVTQIPGLSGITAIAAGAFHTLALKSDGTVWAWGDETYGQVGDGTVSDTPVLTPVQVLTNIQAIAAGDSHNLALAKDGTVWAWGSNTGGELGAPLAPNNPTPRPIAGLPGVVSLAAGGGFSVARMSDDTVWSWGGNFNSNLGDGTNVTRATPAQVPGLSAIKAISCGEGHVLALDANGLIWAWGLNVSGELGRPYLQFSASPVVIAH